MKHGYIKNPVYIDKDAFGSINCSVKLSQQLEVRVQPSNWAERSANPGCCVFDCVYGESQGLLKKNIKLGHSKMVLKYCAVSTLPHHLTTYSWGTQYKAQPFTTVLLLAASSLRAGPGINRRLYCNYF